MQATLIVVLMSGFMLRQLSDVNFKWRELIKTMPSLLAVKEISSFKF